MKPKKYKGWYYNVIFSEDDGGWYAECFDGQGEEAYSEIFETKREAAREALEIIECTLFALSEEAQEIDICEGCGKEIDHCDCDEQYQAQLFQIGDAVTMQDVDYEGTVIDLTELDDGNIRYTIRWYKWSNSSFTDYAYLFDGNLLHVGDVNPRGSNEKASDNYPKNGGA